MSQKHLDELHITADQYIQQLTLSYTNHMRWLSEHAQKSKLAMKYQNVRNTNLFGENRVNKENRVSNATELQKLKQDFEKKKEQERKLDEEKQRRVEQEKAQRLEIEKMRQEQERIYKEDQERLRLDQERMERAEQERQRKLEEERFYKLEQERQRKFEEDRIRQQVEKERAIKLEIERIEREKLDKERMERDRLEKERIKRVEEERIRQQEEKERLYRAEQERLRVIKEEEERAERVRLIMEQEKLKQKELEMRLKNPEEAKIYAEEQKQNEMKKFQNQFDKFIPPTPVVHQTIYPTLENPNFKHTVTQTIKEELPDGTTKIETLKTSTQKKSTIIPPTEESKLKMDDNLWKFQFNTPDKSNQVFSPAKKEIKEATVVNSSVVDNSRDSIDSNTSSVSITSISTIGSVDDRQNESYQKSNRIRALEQSEAERKRLEELERAKKEKKLKMRKEIEERRLAAAAEEKKKKEDDIRKKLDALRPLNSNKDPKKEEKIVKPQEVKPQTVNRVVQQQPQQPQQPIVRPTIVQPEIQRVVLLEPVEYVNYPLSDLEYNSESDDEEERRRRAKKTIPKWAQGERLIQLGFRTKTIDPNLIFADFSGLNIKDIWKYETGLSLRPRSSSQHWDKDGLTPKEEIDYNKQMGFHK